MPDAKHMGGSHVTSQWPNDRLLSSRWVTVVVERSRNLVKSWSISATDLHFQRVLLIRNFIEVGREVRRKEGERAGGR